MIVDPVQADENGSIPRKLIEGEGSSSAQQDQNLLTVAKGGGLVFASTLLSRIINYVYMAVLIWGLGGEDFGLLTLTLALIYFFSILAQLGLTQGIIHFGAIHSRQPDKISLHKITLLSLKISFSLACFFFLLLIAGRVLIADNFFQKPPLADLIAILSCSVVILPIQSLLLSAFKAIKIVKYSAYVDVIQPLLALILAVLMIALGLGLRAVALSFVVSCCLSLVFVLIFYVRLIPGLSSHDAESVPVRKLLKFSLPLSVTQWLHYANDRTEVFFLGFFSSALDVGLYRIAWSLAGLETMLRISLQEIIGPFSADLTHRKKTAELEAIYKTTAKWTFTGGLVLFLMYVLFGGTILNFLEPDYVRGVQVLILLGLAQLFNEMTGACGTILTMSGRSDLSLLNTVVLFLLSVSLDWTLIPRFGLLGAGLAGAGTVVVINLLQVVEVWLLQKIHPFKPSFFKPVISGLISAALVGGLRWMVAPTSLWADMVLAFLFVGAFTAILILAKFDSDDLVVLNAVKRKLPVFRTASN